jgi:hypothetical protein
MTAMQSNDQGDGVVLKLVPLEPNRGTGPATGLASGGAMGLPNLASVAIVVAIIYLAKPSPSRRW